MRAERRQRRSLLAALALPVLVAACGELVIADPHAEIRGTYDLHLMAGNPLPTSPADRNAPSVVAGSLTLDSRGRFVRVINGVEYPGAYHIRGDTVRLRFDAGLASQTYHRDGAALVELAEPGMSTVWVKQGEEVPAEFRVDRYSLVRKEPPTYFPTLLTGDVWLGANGRYHISFGSIPGSQAGEFTVRDDTLVSFDPRIVVIDESEGVLKGDTLRIGSLVYAKR